MSAGEVTRDDFNDFLCEDCGHAALKHVVHRGPCSECWALGLKICERFKPRAEDRAAIKALLEKAGLAL